MRLLILLVCCFLCVVGKSQGLVIEDKTAPAVKEILRKTGYKLDSVDVVIVPNKQDENFYQLPMRVLYKHFSSNTITARVRLENLNHIIQSKSILFIDRKRQPKEEISSGATDFNLNKIRYAQSLYPSLNGDSIHISIKEQAFDKEDIDLKGRIINTVVAAPTTTAHASIMATIAAGGGNSSEGAKGVAPASIVSSSNFETLLPDEDSFYIMQNISVQNHSYGTGIENYYGADAAAYDLSVWRNKNLVHVFSAGNDGINTSTSGIYAGVPRWANITGSFKMAKNIITVGHVDSFNSVVAFSSRGPAFDGQIRPHLVAFGSEGSSGAAAMVSGAAAVVQQVYKLRSGAKLPSASLVKAVLINSADDVGTSGPDFTSGYGSLNLYRALETIHQNRFIEDSIQADHVKQFKISIPANTSRLKLTLSWTDEPATVNSIKALINDLDLTLRSVSTRETWSPWILPTKPNSDSLSLVAIRGTDTLNTTEQIIVNAPLAGEYLIEAKGQRLTSSPQLFSIAYQIDTVNHFSWTFPLVTEPLLTASENIIRWQTNIQGKGLLEFKTVNSDWKLIDANINTSNQYFKWQVPDSSFITQLRMTIDGQSFLSDQFLVLQQLNMKVGFYCADSILLYWNSIPQTKYQVYQLGDQYMEPFQVITDTFIVLNKSQYQTYHFAVAPLIDNATGRRSITIDYTTQGVGCYLRSFNASFNNNTAMLNAEIGSLFNVASVAFQKLTPSDTQTVKLFSQPTNTLFNFTDVSLTRGVNSYRLAVRLRDGTMVYSPIENVYYFPTLPVIIYPVPARADMPIKVIATEPDVSTIMVYDAIGRLVHQQMLDDRLSEMKPFMLSKGLYVVKIVSKEGRIGIQKIVVQ